MKFLLRQTRVFTKKTIIFQLTRNERCKKNLLPSQDLRRWPDFSLTNLDGSKLYLCMAVNAITKIWKPNYCSSTEDLLECQTVLQSELVPVKVGNFLLKLIWMKEILAYKHLHINAACASASTMPSGHIARKGVLISSELFFLLCNIKWTDSRIQQCRSGTVLSKSGYGTNSDFTSNFIVLVIYIKILFFSIGIDDRSRSKNPTSLWIRGLERSFWDLEGYLTILGEFHLCF